MATFEWDENKAKSNKAKHGVTFDDAMFFEFDNAMIIEDDDLNYGENRMVGVGFIRNTVHVIVFVEANDAVRVISLRKANNREIDRYVEYIEKGW